MITEKVKIEKVENGYILETLYYLNKIHIFKTFKELVDFLRIYFDEETKITFK